MLLKLKLSKSCVRSTTTKSSLSIGNQKAIDVAVDKFCLLKFMWNYYKVVLIVF